MEWTKESITFWKNVVGLWMLGIFPGDLEDAMHEKYMTVEQVAYYLNYHLETIRRLTRERILQGVTAGGKWQYKKEQIDQDLAEWSERRRLYFARRRYERKQLEGKPKRKRSGGRRGD